MTTDTATSPLIAGGSPTIFITDMDRAVEFYTGTLALRMVHRAGDHFAMIDAGRGCLIGLHPPSPSAAPPGTTGAVQVGLNVGRPIAEVVRILQERGVVFTDGPTGPVRDDGPVKLAYFHDPDGNVLYLCEAE